MGKNLRRQVRRLAFQENLLDGENLARLENRYRGRNRPIASEIN